jgi:hypothetical protein
VSDKQAMQEEQPLQVARCTKIIQPDTADDTAKYVINVKQIAKVPPFSSPTRPFSLMSQHQLSLIPTVDGNTVRSFSTHGQQPAAKGSSTTVSHALTSD